MRSIRFAKRAGTVGLLLFLLTSLTAGRVRANEPKPYGPYLVSHDPAIGYAVAIQHVYQFPAPFVYQPVAPAGYAVAIPRLYQYQAPFPYQPPYEVPFGGVVYSAYDQYAGPAFIPR
jgi:hypothetical protein